MKAGIILGIVLGFIVGALLIGGIALTQEFSQPDTYTGTILFTSDKDYADFKSALLDKNVKIHNLDSLNNNEQWVAFSIEVPRDYDFAYGETTSHDDDITFPLVNALIGGFLISFAGGALGYAFSYPRNN